MAGLIRFSEALKGESRVKGYEGDKGWIQLNSISQTITRAIAEGRTGNARHRSGVVLEDITIEKELDKSSPYLIKAVCAGSVFNKVEIELCTMSSDPSGAGELLPYLKFKLDRVKVTSYEFSGSGTDDGEIPTETLKLNFDEIEWYYQQYKDENELGDFSQTGWKVEQGVPK